MTTKEVGLDAKAYSKAMLNTESYCRENLHTDFRKILKEENHSAVGSASQLFFPFYNIANKQFVQAFTIIKLICEHVAHMMLVR